MKKDQALFNPKPNPHAPKLMVICNGNANNYNASMQHRLTIGRYYECLENVGNRDTKKFIAFLLYFQSLKEYFISFLFENSIGVY